MGRWPGTADTQATSFGDLTEFDIDDIDFTDFDFGEQTRHVGDGHDDRSRQVGRTWDDGLTLFRVELNQNTVHW